jgi:hypothetical protein
MSIPKSQTANGTTQQPIRIPEQGEVDVKDPIDILVLIHVRVATRNHTALIPPP